MNIQQYPPSPTPITFSVHTLRNVCEIPYSFGIHNGYLKGDFLPWYPDMESITLKPNFKSWMWN